MIRVTTLDPDFGTAVNNRLIRVAKSTDQVAKLENRIRVCSARLFMSGYLHVLQAPGVQYPHMYGMTLKIHYQVPQSTGTSVAKRRNTRNVQYTYDTSTQILSSSTGVLVPAYTITFFILADKTSDVLQFSVSKAYRRYLGTCTWYKYYKLVTTGSSTSTSPDLCKDRRRPSSTWSVDEARTRCR